MRVLSLYIHVPFCTRRCSYCSFFHTQSRPELESGYVAALEEELRFTLGAMASPRLRSVFIGGGTPSVLGGRALERVLASFENWVDPAVTEEITVELNPEDVTPELVSFLRERRVNRLSLGVQSMDTTAQRTLKRCTPRQNRRAIDLVLDEFDNVSFDVLIGVPGSSEAVFRDTLRALCTHRPAHFSVYCLEPGGDLAHEVADFFDGVDPERSAGEYLYACEHLAEAGYDHYEISNFSIPGRSCVHNAVYWSGGEYVGAGPGAHSYLNGERFHNAPSLGDYLSHRGADRPARRKYDVTDEVDSRLEKMMLGLRTARGVPGEWCRCSEETLRDLEGDGLIERPPGRVCLTDRGFLVLNDLVFRLGGSARRLSATG